MDFLGDDNRKWIGDLWGELLEKIPKLKPEKLEELLESLRDVGIGMAAVGAFLEARTPATHQDDQPTGMTVVGAGLTREDRWSLAVLDELKSLTRGRKQFAAFAKARQERGLDDEVLAVAYIRDLITKPDFGLGTMESALCDGPEFKVFAKANPQLIGEGLQRAFAATLLELFGDRWLTKEVPKREPAAGIRALVEAHPLFVKMKADMIARAAHLGKATPTEHEIFLHALSEICRREP